MSDQFRKPRAGSIGDRDKLVRKTPPRGVAEQLAPSESFEAITETFAHDPVKLAEMRERRPTEKRVGHLEVRVDEVVESIGAWRAEQAKQIGDVAAAVGTLTGEVRGLKTVVETSVQREHITFTSKVEVDKANKLDTIDARKAKRDLWLKIAGAVITGGLLGKLLHMAGIL